MRYDSGRAFRQALEHQLNLLFQERNIPLVRLRKQVAFERFLARLQHFQPDAWILKGGLAMQLRLGSQSRTTKDIDLLNYFRVDHLYETLVDVATRDMGDLFTFEVLQKDNEPGDELGGERYQIKCLLDGRLFETFHIDVGSKDVLIADVDHLPFEPILAFAGIQPVQIPCYPICNQIAEKFHALTRLYRSGESSRAKDFVDILLLAKVKDIPGTTLSLAIQITFKIRDTHPIPTQMPKLAVNMYREYGKLAKELALPYADIQQAENALAAFLNPVLQYDDPGSWQPAEWKWKL